MPEAGMNDASFNTLITRVQETVDRINNKMRELFGAAETMLSKIPRMLVPEGFVERVRSLLQRADQLVRKLLSKVAEYLAAPGLPSELRASADKWSTQAGEQVRTVGDDIGTAKMRVGDYWRGNAANAYRDTLDRQNEACDEMVVLMGEVSDLLRRSASTIESFWMTILLSLIPVIAGIVGAIAGAITGVGAPAGLLTLIAGVLTSLGGFAVGVYNAKKSYDDLKNNAVAMQEKISNNSTFNNGWPAATVQGTWKAD